MLPNDVPDTRASTKASFVAGSTSPIANTIAVHATRISPTPTGRCQRRNASPTPEKSKPARWAIRISTPAMAMFHGR